MSDQKNKKNLINIVIIASLAIIIILLVFLFTSLSNKKRSSKKTLQIQSGGNYSADCPFHNKDGTLK